MIKKIEMKRYISWWAFLSMRQFSYNDSLKELRKDFVLSSKEPNEKPAPKVKKTMLS